jgi:hypothetical protein
MPGFKSFSGGTSDLGNRWHEYDAEKENLIGQKMVRGRKEKAE